MLRRLGTLDRVLVLTLVPLWAVCFGLSLKAIVRQTAYASVYVSAPVDARGYPTVIGPRFGHERSKLRVGDRLLRVGKADLRGVGPVAFRGVVGEEAGAKRRLTVVFERAGEKKEAPLPLTSARVLWPFLQGIFPRVRKQNWI